MSTQSKHEKPSGHTLSPSQKDLRAKLYYLSNIIKQTNDDLAYNRDVLNNILTSQQWKIAQKLFAIAEKIKINGVLRRTIKQDSTRPDVLSLLEHLPPQRIIPTVYDFSPYKNIQLLKDIAVQVIAEDFPSSMQFQPYAIVTPVWNEAAGIIDYLKSIAAQSLQPAEIFLVDDHSTDNTVALIEDFASGAKLPITVIKLPKRVPISHVRNAGLKKVSVDIVVMADAGTVLDKNYCRNLVGCFTQFPKADLAAGRWQAIKDTEFTKPFIPEWDNVNWETWLPSTRTMAIKRSLAKKIQYFPEHVFYGDDTLFDYHYRRISNQWVFNKKAITYWDAPTTKERSEKVNYNYGIGDGEIGLGEYFYSDIILAAQNQHEIFPYMPANEKFLAGYIQGRLNRGMIELEKRKIKGVVLFLTTVPFYENNRSAILRRIQQLIDQNYKVFAIHFYPNVWQLPKKIFLPLDYTLLEMYFAETFSIDELFVRYPKSAAKMQVLTDGSNQLYDELIKQFRAKHISVTRLSSQS